MIGAVRQASRKAAEATGYNDRKPRKLREASTAGVTASFMVLRRFSCNLTAPDTPLRVDVGSDDCVSAGLVDEWLQGGNELSIEIF
ncbi:MAG TPA: hypothetical protein VGB15_15260, partial [Longimicrobium sp.]